jgi:hypothetical protein
MLNQAEVASYLIERGLLSPQRIVDGDFTVRDASRRNRNFRVESKAGPSYLLKQGFLKQGFGPDGTATIAHEASVYQALSRREDFHRFLPGFFNYDPSQRVLVLELVGDGEDLRAYHLRRGRFPTTVAAAVGRVLGRLHRATASGTATGLEDQPPWVLMVHRPDLSVFREASVASLDLIKMVQQAPAVGQRLDELRAQWRVSALIHRDVKWDNFVVVLSPTTRRVTGVKLVDWEAAGAGDPRWDIGSVFSHYLSFWVFSIPITGQTPPTSFAKLARYPLSRMRSALQSCWAAYVAERELAASPAQELLYGAVQFAGARLVQTAFEMTQASMLITSAVVLHLQLAMNILQRPQEAAVHLLGLPGTPGPAR